MTRSATQILSRRGWELDLIAEADHFTVTTPIREQRAPGQPMRYHKVQFWSLGEAAQYARFLRGINRRAPLAVYAVRAATECRPEASCCVSESDWP